MNTKASMITRNENNALRTMKQYVGDEEITLEYIVNTLYVFGSELATLRLLAKYTVNGQTVNPKVRIGYSKNLKTHYFSLDL